MSLFKKKKDIEEIELSEKHVGLRWALVAVFLAVGLICIAVFLFSLLGKTVAQMDISALFEQMPNKRYVYAIRRLVLEDAEPKDVAEELQVSVENLYNIKKRAIASMTQVALNETERYEKEINGQ